MAATYADIQQRVYRGAIDTPKTNQSVRQAALPEGLLRDIEVWRAFAVETSAGAWVLRRSASINLRFMPPIQTSMEATPRSSRTPRKVSHKR
jgi:hypothetical protein